MRSDRKFQIMLLQATKPKRDRSSRLRGGGWPSWVIVLGVLCALSFPVSAEVPGPSSSKFGGGLNTPFQFPRIYGGPAVQAEYAPDDPRLAEHGRTFW